MFTIVRGGENPVCSRLSIILYGESILGTLLMCLDV